jgi:hypothetical protein
MEIAKSKNPMTAGELLEALKKLTPEQLKLPVSTEGCDCDGDVYAVEDQGTDIYLRRS